MDLLVERADVWASAVEDKAGGLSGALTALREAGADLQFIIARRAPEKPGTAVVFVTPLQSDREIRAAAQVGFNVSRSLHCLRIMGADWPGAAAALTNALADAGINVHGFSASVLGSQFVAYVALDSPDDAGRATEILTHVKPGSA